MDISLVEFNEIFYKVSQIKAKDAQRRWDGALKIVYKKGGAAEWQLEYPSEWDEQEVNLSKLVGAASTLRWERAEDGYWVFPPGSMPAIRA